MVMQAIDQIAGDPAKDQAQGDLPQDALYVKMAAPQEKGQERQNRNDGQEIIPVAEQTPGRAGVAPLYKFEKAVDDHALLRRSQPPEHQEFGRLVQGDNSQRD
jgi:hypothetical protein